MEMSGQFHVPAALPWIKDHIYGAVWAAEPVSTLQSREKCLGPFHNRTPILLTFCLKPVGIPAVKIKFKK
jgi:hypothetical protein